MLTAAYAPRVGDACCKLWSCAQRSLTRPDVIGEDDIFIFSAPNLPCHAADARYRKKVTNSPLGSGQHVHPERSSVSMTRSH